MPPSGPALSELEGPVGEEALITDNTANQQVGCQPLGYPTCFTCITSFHTQEP